MINNLGTEDYETIYDPTTGVAIGKFKKPKTTV
jgi:hypothetical protein